MKKKKHSTAAFRDLIILTLIVVTIAVLSYFFSVFSFLVDFFQKYPGSLTYIDEIISVLIALSLGLAVFAWRRWLELKKETAERIKLQEELLRITETKAETERIINKQLRCEIDLRKEDSC